MLLTDKFGLCIKRIRIDIASDVTNFVCVVKFSDHSEKHKDQMSYDIKIDSRKGMI